MAEQLRSIERQVQRLQARSEVEIASLSPRFADRIRTVLTHLEKKGWVPVVYHGQRTREEQEAKLRAGYSKTLQSFHVNSTALSKSRNGLHWVVRGEAADIVDARFLWTGPAADLEFQFWKDLGHLARVIGLRWGGDWKKFRDVAHVEMTEMQFSQDTRGTFA